jgi:hypothetical protein
MDLTSLQRNPMVKAVIITLNPKVFGMIWKKNKTRINKIE